MILAVVGSHQGFCPQWKIEEVWQPRFNTEFHSVSACELLSPLSEDLLRLCVYRQASMGSNVVLQYPLAKKEGVP